MVKAISQFSKEMNTYNNMHFLDGVDETSEYTYNANGCMTKDKNKGFQTVRYNQLSLPSYVKTKKGPSEKITYNIRGEKLRIRKNMQIDVPRPWLDSITPATPHVYPVIEQPDIASLQDYVVNPAIGEIVPFPTIDYCGSVVYNNNQLQYVLEEGGFISCESSTPRYHFFLRDHLGSNRVVATHTGQVEQRNMFYPYGASRADCWSDSAMVQRWKYSGKELDNFQGLHCYDYGFRWYDPIVCRWTTPDPMREKYYDISAYVYCMGNPLKLIDLFGLALGDFFRTVNAAAIDFGLFYNDNSIREGREYGSSIYIVYNRKGEKGYSYSIPNKGKIDEVVPSDPPIGYALVADIHTHGNYKPGYRNNEFSGLRKDKRLQTKQEVMNVRSNSDIGISNATGVEAYLVTPNGSLQKYDPSSGVVTIISNNMPSDVRDPQHLNSVDSNYENNCMTPADYLKIWRKIITNDYE